MGKRFKIRLSTADEENLVDIANTFGISEKEVIRQGLRLMALSAALKKQGTGLHVLDGEEFKEIVI